jgi:hypothetical protein
LARLFEELSYRVGSVTVVDGTLAVLARAREEFRSVSVWALSAAELPDFLDLLDALDCQIAAKRLEVIREIDVQGIAVEQGATRTAAWLRDRYRMSQGAANRLVKLAAQLDTDLAATADALYGGEINVEQAQEIAKAVGKLPPSHRAAVALNGEPSSRVAAPTWARNVSRLTVTTT